MGSVHKYDASQIQFGSHLEREAVYHIQFLKKVHEAGYLKQTHVLKRAIYRYEKYWLPLAADYAAECLCAPLGIEWVWHCHMLCPRAYEQDCIAIVNRPIYHVLRDANDFKAAQLKSQSYWSWKYQHDHEPFHVDYTAPYDPSAVESFQSKLSYDILSAAQRQMSFYYQVSLPHYQDQNFLQSSILRYRMFIYLKMRLPEEFLVPCYDIDLMWHTHQLNPFVYKNDMYRLLGRMLNHDDSTTDRSVGSKLSIATDKTRQHWMHFYNESFTFFGAMYRGNPPVGVLYRITPEEIIKFSTKSCSITFDSITLSLTPSGPKQYKNICLYAHCASNNIQQSQMVKWRRPKSCPQGSSTIIWNGIQNINTFNGKTSNNITFTLKEKSGFCIGSEVVYGSNYIPILHTHVEAEQNLQNGGMFHEGIQISQEFSLEVKGHFSRPHSAGVVLSLQLGRYELATVPENIRELWGPVSLDRLPQGVDNRCQVASHRLVNHMGKIEFTVRSIHSAPLVMSVVQVFYHDKMSAIAHLIASDQLPLPTQVFNNDGRSITLNPKQGERAVLIKNNGGDWGIVTGRWDGYRQGVAPVGGTGGQHGSSGTLCIQFYSIPSKGKPQELTLGYNLNKYDFSLASSQVDLHTGTLTIDPSCEEVAENIALAFSVSLLHVLCVPRPKGWKEGQQVKPPPITRGSREVKGIPSDDMALIVASGLLISSPSNYYFHSLHGPNMCAMCGGGVVGYNYNDHNLASSTHGYGHHGTGCGGGACGTVTSSGCSGGCGGCSGACGGGCGGGGCSGGCGGGCGGCGGCGGGCGGCG